MMTIDDSGIEECELSFYTILIGGDVYLVYSYERLCDE